ncbi:MAG TPA: SRPBCC domain-containing protein [Polyangiaceae bacterium]|jgi:uncharacterized protein YndB with AHSA1/START domain|nr:SRPBCC domain-containing protein [Polyangiaceae bacterium]
MNTEQETQSIVVAHELPHPPEKVWRALTESKLVAAWLMPNDLRPVVGHRFTFRAQPIPGWDGVCHCEVLAVEPARRLSYTWRGGSDDATHYGSRLDTVVTWTLTPTSSGGTHLELVHSGFTAKNAHAFDMMSKGWRSMVTSRISDVIAKDDS